MLTAFVVRVDPEQAGHALVKYAGHVRQDKEGRSQWMTAYAHEARTWSTEEDARVWLERNPQVKGTVTRIQVVHDEVLED